MILNIQKKGGEEKMKRSRKPSDCYFFVENYLFVSMRFALADVAENIEKKKDARLHLLRLRSEKPGLAPGTGFLSLPVRHAASRHTCKISDFSQWGVIRQIDGASRDSW